MKIALITPSHSSDLSRCKLLSQTVDRWVDPSIDHVVIVSKKDYHPFTALPSRSRVITVESILPEFAWQVPFFDRLWITLRSIPIRGWILQQLVKLSAAACLDYDVFVFVDSDVVIIRPVTNEIFVRDGNVRLYKSPGAARTERHMRWHRVAAQKLGLETRDYFGADYIGNLISWYKPNVKEMLHRIETVSRKNWFFVLANTLYFAEYILYGIYVDFIAGETANHFVECNDLCHCSWFYGINSPGDIASFIDAVKEEHIAILIQSNKGFDVDSYYGILKSKKLI